MYRRGGNLPPATWGIQPVGLNGMIFYISRTVLERFIRNPTQGCCVGEGQVVFFFFCSSSGL